MSYVVKFADQQGLYEWTKKLGQQHFSVPGAHTTLCGMPMLGNNYARAYNQDDKTTCPGCEEEVSYRKSCQEMNI